MCSSDIVNILDTATDTASAVESGVNTVVNAAGEILNEAGEVVGNVASQVHDPSLGGAIGIGTKPLVFFPQQQTGQAEGLVGDALEYGRQELIDPIGEGIAEGLSAPFDFTLGAVEDLTQGALGSSASVLGQAGGFYSSSDQLGGVPSPIESAPIQARYDSRNADFLRDQRDRRYLNTRSTLLTGSQGVTDSPRTRQNNIFGSSNRLGG